MVIEVYNHDAQNEDMLLAYCVLDIVDVFDDPGNFL